MTNKIDLSPIFDVYSMREQTAGDAVKPLTQEFKNRVGMFCEEMVPAYDHYSHAGHKIADYWMTLRDKLRYLHGIDHLADKNRHNPYTEVEKFLSECSDEHYLDFIEMFFQSEKLPTHFSDRELKEAVNNINNFFNLDDLPYALTEFSISESRTFRLRIQRLLSPLRTRSKRPGPPRAVSAHTQPSSLPIRIPKIEAFPQIIRRDSQAIHQTAIRPALRLLADPAFKTANQEFLDALGHYRKGEYADCMAKCGSSFESVMKVICDRKKWPYQQTYTAQKLLDTIFAKTGMEPFFKDPIMLVATIRNRFSSAHGAGTQQRSVPEHRAQHAINATASAILLLVEETKQ